MATVSIKHVTKAFGDNIVLKEFNEAFQDGEFVTLLGPSGCGKTTMLRMIAGFEIPTGGEIWLGDRLVSGEKAFVPPEHRDIGMVFQSYAVWPHMTVYENVIYPLKIRKTDKNEIKRKADHILEVVHLTQYRDRLPSQLSGGQQQRVSIARAMITDPDIILADEPTGNLDSKATDDIVALLKMTNKTFGQTIIMITHNPEIAKQADRIIQIKDGKVSEEV